MRLKKFAAALLSLAAFCLFALSLGAPGAQAAGKKLRVAFVLLESIDDHGWNTAHHDGIEYLKQRLGDQGEQVHHQHGHQGGVQEARHATPRTSSRKPKPQESMAASSR